MPASGYLFTMVVVTCVRISRSCVAHAVESHWTVNVPSSIETGSECAASSAPTMSGQAVISSDWANGLFQPSSLVTAERTSAMPRGSRPVPNGWLGEPNLIDLRFRASRDRELGSPNTRRNRR
ncbi:hypothetical protein ASL10_03120 [Frigoribacterium sp. Leaf8]|nr:hypothetical protein ASL10_03120 [Frigoribacterium sp. Leaf8]